MSTLVQRLCACGCKTPLDGRRTDCEYASDACRKRHDRGRDPAQAKTASQFWEAVSLIRRSDRHRARQRAKSADKARNRRVV